MPAIYGILPAVLEDDPSTTDIVARSHQRWIPHVAQAIGNPDGDLREPGFGLK
jgi:hypothetical protein